MIVIQKTVGYHLIGPFSHSFFHVFDTDFLPNISYVSCTILDTTDADTGKIHSPYLV
jgi:hypothetical protein